ncbi:MAG: two-component system histidine kinase PnpS [Nitrospiraceae bacterium]
MTLSIRWKVALGTLCAMTVGLAVAWWLSVRSIESIELARLTEALEARTGLAAITFEPLLQKFDRLTPDPSLQALAREIGQRALARVTLIGPDGTVLADSATDDRALGKLDNHGTRPEVLQAWSSGQGTDMRVSETTGYRMLYVALRVIPAETKVGHRVVVRLALPLTKLESQILTVERSLAIALGVAFLASFLLSVVIARGLTTSLSEMAVMARDLATGSTSKRIPVTSKDEVGVLAMALNDMTTQLEAKMHQVSEERAQLLAVLVSMAEGVMVLDCRGIVLQVNPALERMFSVKAGDARGRSHWEVIRHHELNELTAHALDGRARQGGELTAAGRRFRVEASIAGGRQDNEACVVLVFHDITAVRRLENVRKDFVANVSHELRTPLTSIKGYVEALIDGGKDDPQTATRFLDIILKQSDRLNLILEDLLQLSQIESGQVSFKHQPVRLGSLIERTVALMKPLADKKGHTLHVYLPDDLPPVVGDEDRLVQVITNLLDNAVKYTPEQGTITVAAHHLNGPRTDPPPFGTVELSVTDTGIGIPEPDRPRVFERFYRVDKARSRELGGTGLGLAIVKHIVEGHGGRVWVEGNHPIGSRFVVRVPAGTMIASADHSSLAITK